MTIWFKRETFNYFFSSKHYNQWNLDVDIHRLFHLIVHLSHRNRKSKWERQSLKDWKFNIIFFQKNTNFFIPYLIFDLFIIWMSFILIIGGLFHINLILIRNCSIFASVKLYPAICNYSLFKKLNGKFKFTRDVPPVLGSPIDFQNKRKSFDEKKKKLKDGNEFELETLHKNKNGNHQTLETVIVNRWWTELN